MPEPAGNKSLFFGLKIGVGGVFDDVGTKDHGTRVRKQTDKDRGDRSIDAPVAEQGIQVLLCQKELIALFKDVLQKHDQIKRNQCGRQIPLNRYL